MSRRRITIGLLSRLTASVGQGFFVYFLIKEKVKQNERNSEVPIFVGENDHSLTAMDGYWGHYSKLITQNSQLITHYLKKLSTKTIVEP